MAGSCWGCGSFAFASGKELRELGHTCLMTSVESPTLSLIPMELSKGLRLQDQRNLSSSFANLMTHWLCNLRWVRVTFLEPGFSHLGDGNTIVLS